MKRTSRRRRTSKDYTTLAVLADRLSAVAFHARSRRALNVTPREAAREHARAAEAHHAAATAATGAHAHEKRSHLAQATEHERLQAQYAKSVQPNGRRRTSRHLQANYFRRFKILDASIDRQDHAGRNVYRIDVEITAPRRLPAAFGGRYAPAQTVHGGTMVVRVYPDGRFSMLDSRGMTEYSPYELTGTQRRKALAAVKKLGGKVPDIYAPRH